MGQCSSDISAPGVVLFSYQIERFSSDSNVDKSVSLVISCNSEIILPGVMRSEVRPPGVSHSPSGCPTWERITPGEILSELPEITTPVRFWPKFLENHTAVNLQKISRGLPRGYCLQANHGFFTCLAS